MADDPTGRSKPTARRRRRARPTGSGADQGAIADPTTHADPASSTRGSAPETPPDGVTGDEAVVDIWPMPDPGRGDHVVCPFLRSIDDSGALGGPVEAPDAVNRCAALAEAVPQSLRQQQLVCLTSAHTSCPRFLRGATVEVEAPGQRTITAPRLTPATLGALALLVAAFSASVMFTFARGGLDLPVAGGAGPGPSESAVAEVPSAAPSIEPSLPASPDASAGPDASPSATLSPSPSPTPTASPTPSPTPVASPTPVPTSDRYALLRPCPDTPDCWIYRVRSGDNLFSIANYFGVPLATVKRLNPWTANGLRAGRDLILPPPTR